MTCRRIHSLLSAYVDSELTGSEMLAIRDHMNRCGECSTEHRSLVALKRILSTLPDKEPRPEFVFHLQNVAERRRLDGALGRMRPTWFVGLHMALFSPVSPATGRRLASVCVISLFGFWFMVAPTATAPTTGLRSHTAMRAARLLNLVGLTLPLSFAQSLGADVNPSMVDPAGNSDATQNRRARLLEARMLSETRSYRVHLLTEPYAQSAFAPSATYSGFEVPSTVYTGYAVSSP